MKLLDTLDPVFPLSTMTIPKLQDIANLQVAKEVDDMLTIDKQISQSMKKSTTFLLFGHDDSQNFNLKTKYMDILMS